MLFQFKDDNILSNEEKQNFLSGIEVNTPFNNEILEKIYDNYVNKYEHSFKRKINTTQEKENTLSFDKEKVYINNEEVSEEEFDEELTKMEEEHFDNVHRLNDSNNSVEQMSLFAPREEELANKICDIFNSFDTKYQNTFEIHNVELQVWEHIKSNKRNLSILLSSPIADMGENAFSYFNPDKTDEIKLNEGIKNNAFLQSLYKDKDFSIYISQIFFKFLFEYGIILTINNLICLYQVQNW